MSVRGLVTVVIGVVAFVVIDSLISNIITGTDTGSVKRNGAVKTPLIRGNLGSLTYQAIPS